MLFYKQSDGKNYTEQQIKAAHPNTSFPKILTAEAVADLGYTPITIVSVEPEFGYTITASDVEIIDGVPTITYTKKANDRTTVKRQQVAPFKAFVETQLDEAAKERDYDSILTAVSYAGSAYDSDAQYYIQLRDNVWKEFYSIANSYFENMDDLSQDFWDSTIVSRFHTS
jgi:hypothetical protein